MTSLAFKRMVSLFWWNLTEANCFQNSITNTLSFECSPKAVLPKTRNMLRVHQLNTTLNYKITEVWEEDHAWNLLLSFPYVFPISHPSPPHSTLFLFKQMGDSCLAQAEALLRFSLSSQSSSYPISSQFKGMVYTSKMSILPFNSNETRDLAFGLQPQ